MFPPRKGDLDRAALEAMAEKVASDYPRQGTPVDIYFKFTCSHCGERCMFAEPNKLYEYGTCAACGKETVILFGGFTIKLTIGPIGLDGRDNEQPDSTHSY